MGARPPGKDIIFVVDTSGSMKQRQVRDAINTVMQIAETPMDDLQIAIVSFGSGTNRWPGTTDRNPQNPKQLLSRNRWSIMPSKDNLDAANAWMWANIDDGSTEPVPALRHAFQTCSGGKGNETVRDLSIIIISDGIFGSDDYINLKTCIQVEQTARLAKNLPEAAIGMVGVDISTSNTRSVKFLLGKNVAPPLSERVWEPDLGILGFYRLEYPAIKEEDE
jgi:Mg-chelatase subunit ChlD